MNSPAAQLKSSTSGVSSRCVSGLARPAPFEPCTTTGTPYRPYKDNKMKEATTWAPKTR